MDPNEIDAASQAIAKAPRVSLEQIKASIGQTYYTSGVAVANHAARIDHGDKKIYGIESLATLTVCMIVMKNGFVVVGKAAPASPDNFNAELGKKFAYDDAIKQLWPLMGFALRDKLHAERHGGEGDV